MNVAFFSARSHDRPAFSTANECFGHRLLFLDARLDPATARLAEGNEAVCASAGDDLGREVIARLAGLGVRVIALRCRGLRQVDLKAAREHGVAVVRVGPYPPTSAAEHTAALILTLCRRTHEAYLRGREGRPSNEGLVGFTLHGLAAGIVGAGPVGLAVARILVGFGCRLLVYDLAPNVLLLPPGAEVVPMDRLLAESDLITLHCPLTPESHRLIDRGAIEQMKPGVMLINTSRGGLLDAAAVLGALEAGQIGHLGLDVYEEEDCTAFGGLPAAGYDDQPLARLAALPNVLITHHQGPLTREALEAVAVTTLGNLACLERGEACANRVS